MWFAMNSDRDNVPQVFTQLIPAGHCTCQTSTSFQCADCLTCLKGENHAVSNATAKPHSEWHFEYGRDGRNLGLGRSQCQASFPGLFQDIRRATEYWKTARGGISREDLDATPLENGMARARIDKGELYVVAVRAKGEDHRRKIVAMLASMYRALSASPERTSHGPIEFMFSVEDRVDDVNGVGHPIWALSRKASEESVWLIPDFGYWAWGHLSNSIGPYNQAVNRVVATESSLPFANKEKKLVWRGKLSFAPKLRRALMDVARDQPWGDVKELDWGRKANYLSMEDHCRYMFIAHVEGTFILPYIFGSETNHEPNSGRSYSASLKYRQACRSVVIAHKLQHIQHHHYLLVSSGPEQNYVEVERDFSDLPRTINWLLENPHVAESIANNNVQTFRERYLTQAADACYWRALWDGWAEASSTSPSSSSNVTSSTDAPRGLRYESFLLLDSREMLQFTFSTES